MRRRSALSAQLALESTCPSSYSELPIERLAFFSFLNIEPRIRMPLHVWSYLAPREAEVKVALTAAVLFEISESIIDAICPQTRGSFSIS